MQLIKYKQDIWAVAFVLCLAISQLVLYFVVDNLYIIIPAVIFMALLQGSATAVNHNHQHLPIFTSTPLNRLFELALFFNTSCGTCAWVLHHTIGHHSHYLDSEKDTCPWKKKDGSTMSAVEFTIINSLKVYPEIFRVGKSHKKVFKTFKIWFAISLTILAAFIIADPLKALIIFVIPMIIQLFLLVYATVDHHRGLDTQDQYAATRNDATKLNNLYSWNLGYHTAHHIKCGLHWTKLPEFHEQIKSKIPSELIREA